MVCVIWECEIQPFFSKYDSVFSSAFLKILNQNSKLKEDRIYVLFFLLNFLSGVSGFIIIYFRKRMAEEKKVVVSEISNILMYFINLTLFEKKFNKIVNR